MKEVAIISGKGGTGKTTVTAALAELWKNKILVDCDVDAANLHLVLKPKVVSSTDFYSGYKAVLNTELCSRCGACRRVCRFEAISADFSIDDLSCTGCGACTLVCPKEAIALHSNLAGKWFMSETAQGPMVHAELGIAEDNSGKLVAQIRSVAKELAKEQGCGTILIDGPPGIGCPVISAVSGVDLVLVVTEPTLSGLHDLGRILTLTQSFGIKSLVCINKYDLNPALTDEISKVCSAGDNKLIGKIPFSRSVVQGMVKAHTQDSSLLENLPAELQSKLKDLQAKVAQELAAL